MRFTSTETRLDQAFRAFSDARFLVCVYAMQDRELARELKTYSYIVRAASHSPSPLPYHTDADPNIDIGS